VIVSFIVRRYLRFDSDQPFIFLAALLAFIGIALGVAVLMVVMAVMNGSHQEFEKKLFVMNYPLTVLPKFYGSVDDELLGKLKKEFPDMQFSPYISAQTIVKSGSKMEGGIIYGVNPEDEKVINPIYAKSLPINTPFRKFDVIVGNGVYEEFSIYPNQKLTYIFTQFNPTGVALTPTMKRFRVIGSFKSGLNAYDKAYNYTTIEGLRRVLNVEDGTYHGVHIHSKEPMEDIKKIVAFLPTSVTVIGWWQQNGNFFAALELEKKALFIVLMLIILIAAVNIISSLLMTVMNRRSEIALLLSLGASAKEIKQVFIMLGIIIGIGGIILGVVLGSGSMWVLENFEIISLPEDVYGTSKLPLALSVTDFLAIVVGSFLITLLASFYPAKKASKIDVLNVLRNE
jgi:putative ABC transport system permease protein